MAVSISKRRTDEYECQGKYAYTKVVRVPTSERGARGGGKGEGEGEGGEMEDGRFSRVHPTPPYYN